MINTPDSRFLRRLPRIAIILLCAVASVRGADTSGGSHTVAGMVKYVANPAKQWRYSRYYVADSGKGWLAECVVVLVGMNGEGKAPDRPSATHVMDQKNYLFVPETMAIRAGDKVRFTNSDGALHNVLSAAKIASFNVNLGKGQASVQTFKTAGGIEQPVQLGCVYHGAMRAWIYVFDHGHFTVTGPDGSFRFKDVSPGKYELVAVHPAGRMRLSQSVEVGSGPVENLVIELSPKSVNSR
jgi:plastocyanin